MTVLWTTMVPAIAAELPDIPKFTAVSAIQREAQEFYRHSRAWRVRDVTLATTVLGQSVYTVATANPAGASLCGLPALWVNGQEAKEMQPGEADDFLPSDTSATPFIGVAGPDSIRLAPKPASAGLVITATVAYEPADSATGLDDELYRLHREAIERAAIARLKAQPGKPWSDPAGALYWRGEANRLRLEASTKAGPTRQRAALRTKAV